MSSFKGCPSIEVGVSTLDLCDDCGHRVGSHLFPSAKCVECFMKLMEDHNHE